jgi:hypothetical protein
MLHTGRDLETKHRLESFLAERGYRVAPVTIDNADYLFARAYDRAADGADSQTMRWVAEVYIEYMQAMFAFYEGPLLRKRRGRCRPRRRPGSDRQSRAGIPGVSQQPG